MVAALGVALAAAWLAGARAKAIGLVVALMLGILVPFVRWTELLFGLFFVTVVHVVVFTSLFLLHGSFKAGRTSGFVSWAVHLACAGVLLAYRPASPAYAIGEYTIEAASAFFALMGHSSGSSARTIAMA